MVSSLCLSLSFCWYEYYHPLTNASNSPATLTVMKEHIRRVVILRPEVEPGPKPKSVPSHCPAVHFFELLSQRNKRLGKTQPVRYLRPPMLTNCALTALGILVDDASVLAPEEQLWFILPVFSLPHLPTTVILETGPGN